MAEQRKIVHKKTTKKTSPKKTNITDSFTEGQKNELKEMMAIASNVDWDTTTKVRKLEDHLTDYIIYLNKSKTAIFRYKESLTSKGIPEAEKLNIQEFLKSKKADEIFFTNIVGVIETLLEQLVPKKENSNPFKKFERNIGKSGLFGEIDIKELEKEYIRQNPNKVVRTQKGDYTKGFIQFIKNIKAGTYHG